LAARLLGRVRHARSGAHPPRSAGTWVWLRSRVLFLAYTIALSAAPQLVQTNATRPGSEPIGIISATSRMARRHRLQFAWGEVMPLPLETPVQMPNTSTAIDPTPINSTARATGSYSSQCQKRESIRHSPSASTAHRVLSSDAHRQDVHRQQCKGDDEHAAGSGADSGFHSPVHAVVAAAGRRSGCCVSFHLNLHMSSA
jgi:hypothetical protein